MLALHHFAAAPGSSRASVLPERAQLFSPEEIGWLREEAIGATRSGLALAGLHRNDPFARLARHPRILSRVRAALGEDIAIAASQLAPRGQLPPPAAGLRAVVDLGPSPQLRALDDADTSGVVAFQADGSEAAGFGRLLFVIDYIPRPAGRTPLIAERDDALWPTPYSTAG
jgi:hypothetical protein